MDLRDKHDLPLPAGSLSGFSIRGTICTRLSAARNRRKSIAV